MSKVPQEQCRSKVELATLAAGMAKQHERYHDALQELIDNAVSSVVKNEAYFDDPTESFTVVIRFRRTEHTVRTTIADNGPGITRDALQNDIFRTGNKNVSDGILNNVGWGLKASLAWFEETLSHVDETLEDPWFTLITGTEPTSRYRVDGPITGNLPISSASKKAWETGLHTGDHDLETSPSGTRVHVSCSRSKFDSDVWPSAKSLKIKAQAIRELLGVKFRRLLNAHPDNQIYIDYIDESTNTQGSLPVVPISPKYVDNENNPPTEYEYDEFTIEGDSGTEYMIEFERGTIDFDGMSSEISKDHPGLFTTSGRFRTRYRPSQSKQGVDIYANGRVLMTSVFTDLFDLTRNNEYNYFGGELRIIPADKSSEVPTDNKKVRLDSNSKIWQQLQETLSEEEYQPEGKRYDDGNEKADSDDSKSNTAKSDLVKSSSTDADTAATDELSVDIADDLFALHQQDSKKIEETVREFDPVPQNEGFVDVTITSPPYFDLKDYGYSQSEQIGQGEPYEQYLEELRDVFKQVYNVTKDTGTLWLVVNTFKENKELVQLPSDIATVCQNLEGRNRCTECGSVLDHDSINQRLYCSDPDCQHEYDRTENSWILQDIVIWNKTKALPYNSDGQFRNVFEYVLCFSKTKSFKFDIDKTRISDPTKFKKWWVEYPERYHPRGKVPANIWEYVTPSQGSFSALSSLDHPAPFPPQLVERVVRLTTEENSVVLDPFAGSGMVPAVADIMGRQSIGFELSPKYCNAYPDVKKEVEEEYGDQLQLDSTANQKELVETIGGLRQLKHIRELLREYADTEGLSSHRDLSIHTAFHRNGEIDASATDEDTFIQSEIYYIVDNDLDEEIKRNLEQRLRTIAQDGLNSSYDISATIHVYSTSEFLEIVVENRFQDKELYVYENGRHYVHTEQISLEDWVRRAIGTNEWRQAFAQDEWPPIISNLEMSITNPRRKKSGETLTPSNSHHEVVKSKLSTAGRNDDNPKSIGKLNVKTDD